MRDRRLNILFVIHTPKSPYTAVYNCYQQLATFLEGHGHRATIVAPEDFPALSRRHARWFPLLYPLWVAAWMARTAHNYQLAVFHSYSGWFVHLLRRCVPAYRQLRLVTAFHGLEPIYYLRLSEEAQRTNQPLRLRFRLLHGVLMPWLIRLGCRRSDRIMCLNSQEADYLQRHNWGGSGQISLVPNGVAPEFFVDRTYTRDVRRILFVGQWREMKGISFLVDAFTTLARQAAELELRCVGTLVAADTVLASFPADLRGRVSVLARTRGQALVSEYRNADIFVFPSLSEGFSSALLEAMAAGLPIVATSVGSAPDLLQSGVNALLVPIRDPAALADSVARLVSDSALRARLGSQAKATATRYELNRVNAWLQSILEQTARRARGGAVSPKCPAACPGEMPNSRESCDFRSSGGAPEKSN